jgi:hypothetical protein
MIVVMYYDPNCIDVGVLAPVASSYIRVYIMGCTCDADRRHISMSDASIHYAY